MNITWPIVFSVLGGSWTTTASSVEDMGSLNYLYTTASGVATTLSVTNPNTGFEVNTASQVVQSMSDEELMELASRLDQNSYSDSEKTNGRVR